MELAVDVLNTLICLVSATLLLLGFFRGRQRLLLWSGLCFAGLAVSNFLVVLDLPRFTEMDFYPWRLLSAAVAMMLLLYGLVWEVE